MAGRRGPHRRGLFGDDTDAVTLSAAVVTDEAGSVAVRGGWPAVPGTRHDQASRCPGDHRCDRATDVAEELGRYIASVPDGTLISFPLLARYLIGTALSIGGRSHLVLDGNRSTLQIASNDWSGAASVIQVWGLP